MSNKTLTCEYSESDKRGFWDRLNKRLQSAGLNEVNVAEACGLEFTDLLDKKFDVVEAKVRHLSQILDCNLHWLMFGVGPANAYYRPKINDKIFVQFHDGKSGHFKVVGIEASSYVLQYSDRNEVISVPQHDISMISKQDIIHKNVELDRNGSTCIVYLRGRLDFNTSEEWHEVIEEIVRVEPKSIIVDCDSLDTISSMGLGLLISAYKLTKDLLCSFTMRNVKGQALNALKDTNLHSILMAEH